MHINKVDLNHSGIYKVGGSLTRDTDVLVIGRRSSPQTLVLRHPTQCLTDKCRTLEIKLIESVYVYIFPKWCYSTYIFLLYLTNV